MKWGQKDFRNYFEKSNYKGWQLCKYKISNLCWYAHSMYHNNVFIWSFALQYAYEIFQKIYQYLIYLYLKFYYIHVQIYNMNGTNLWISFVGKIPYMINIFGLHQHICPNFGLQW